MIEKDIIVDMRELIDDIKKKVDNGQSVVIKGEGVSMLPFITCEDLLTLQKPTSKKVKTGEVYLYNRCDGSYAIHRVYATSKDVVFMLGDAQLFIEKIHKSSLIAMVSKVEKPDKTVDCLSFWVRIGNVLRMKRRIYKARCKFLIRRFRKKTRRALSKIKKNLMKER